MLGVSLRLFSALYKQGAIWPREPEGRPASNSICPKRTHYVSRKEVRNFSAMLLARKSVSGHSGLVTVRKAVRLANRSHSELLIAIAKGEFKTVGYQSAESLIDAFALDTAEWRVGLRVDGFLDAHDFSRILDVPMQAIIQFLSTGCVELSLNRRARGDRRYLIAHQDIDRVRRAFPTLCALSTAAE